MSGSVGQVPGPVQMPPAMQQAQGAPQMPAGGPQMPAGGQQQPQAMPGAQQPQSGYGGSTINYQPPPIMSAPIPPPFGTPSQQPGMAELAKAAKGKGKGGKPRLTPDEMARLGRYGDAVVAHMTPGEIAVPPEVQTPQVQATLSQAFQQAGVSPQQFVAGSPASSINPHTGAPEYSFWSAILPVLGAIGGSFIPGIGTAAGMAVGGGLGGAAGTLADKGTPMQALLSGLGGAAGGYVGGGGFGDLFGAGAQAASGATGAATNAAGAAASSTPFTSTMSPDLMSKLQGMAPGVAPGAADAVSEGVMQSGADLLNKQVNPTIWDQIKAAPWKGALLAGGGSTIASMFAPPQSQSTTPPGFGQPMPALNSNYNSILGNGNATYPSFTGYNPYQAVTGGGYNFYQPR